MRWLHLPIVDVSVPSQAFERQWRYELPDLRSTLDEGGKVLVHCKGGLGRAGMVAAFLLIESRERPDVAICKVRQVRPGAIDTPAQERMWPGTSGAGKGIELVRGDNWLLGRLLFTDTAAPAGGHGATDL